MCSYNTDLYDQLLIYINFYKAHPCICVVYVYMFIPKLHNDLLWLHWSGLLCISAM